MLHHFFKSRVFFLIIALCFAIVGGVIFFELPQDAPQATQTSLAGYIEHKMPRPLPLLQFFGKDNTPQSLTDLEGNIVVLNLWASWCAPCRQEMPQLDALQADFADKNFIVVALSLDKNPDKGDAFLDELGITHIVRNYDPKGIAFRKLGIVGLPTTLIIDARGGFYEIGRLAGEAEWHGQAAIELVQRLLKN